jgi:glycosyltransferase involved in cell wall biosynthesis
MALARELGLERRVRFHGVRSHEEALAAIGSADLVVVPSKRAPNGDTESSSLATREALAIGVPVVATSSGGIPENFPPEQRSQLVRENDPEALARGVLACLSDRARWPERTRAAREFVEREFDSRMLARRVASIYEGVVAARGAGGPHTNFSRPEAPVA